MRPSTLARNAACAALLTAGVRTPARAQSDEIVLGASLLGYVVLSTGAVARLAERARPLGTGDSVQIAVARPGSVVRYAGRIEAVMRDSIALTHADSTAGVARGDLIGVRTYQGNEKKWAQGWAIGLVSGAAIGATVGAASGGSPPNCEFICPNASQTALIVGIAGGIAGSVVGAGIGSLVDGAHWRAANPRALARGTSRAALAPVIGPRRFGARVDVRLR